MPPRRRRCPGARAGRCALVAAATSTLALAGSAFARGPLPLPAVRLGPPVAASVSALVVVVVIAIAAAVLLVLLASRQSGATQATSRSARVTLADSRQGAEAGDAERHFA